jgi:hypothetical protein
MKKFKQIDLWLQLTALLVGITSPAWGGDLFFAYFLVGGAQLLSFFVHLFAGPAIGRTPGRRKYGTFLIVLVILLVLGMLTWTIFFILIGLLMVAPVVAILYASMCYNELYELKSERYEKLEPLQDNGFHQDK